MRPVIAAFSLYALAVVGGILHAYPAVLRSHDPPRFFSQPPRPVPHVPVVGRGSHETPGPDGTLAFRTTDAGWIEASASDGRLQWRMRVAQAPDGIPAAPVTDATNLYVGASNGTFYALRKASGDLAWAIRLGDDIHTSALLDGGDIYVGVGTFDPPDGFIARLDRNSGRVVWLSPWLGAAPGAIPRIDHEAGVVLVDMQGGGSAALDIDSGESRRQGSLPRRHDEPWAGG
jgi:outer membrane protein assembly factor BamB